MCVLCFNSQWRSVVIGASGAVISLALVLATAALKNDISNHFQAALEVEGCLDKGGGGGGVDEADAEEVGKRPSPWPSTYVHRDSGCIFLVFDALFPWPLWTVLGAYFLLSASLVVSATYCSLTGVTAYLFVDAFFVGLLAASLCLSFFPPGLVRVALLTILAPLFSLALCAWMTVFGFYLRLEDRHRRRQKRLRAVRDIEREHRITGGNEEGDEGEEGGGDVFTNLAYEQSTPSVD